MLMYQTRSALERVLCRERGKGVVALVVGTAGKRSFYFGALPAVCADIRVDRAAMRGEVPNSFQKDISPHHSGKSAATRRSIIAISELLHSLRERSPHRIAIFIDPLSHRADRQRPFHHVHQRGIS